MPKTIKSSSILRIFVPVVVVEIAGFGIQP